MINLDMVHSGILNSIIKSILHIRCAHGSEEFPGDDVSGKIIQNR